MANKIMLGLSGTFLLLGLGSLIVGIILPISLHNQLVTEGITVAQISAEDDPNVWANIPGDRGYDLTQEYQFFEIVNPENYQYGIKPQARSVGTVVFTETRTTTSDIIEKEVTTWEEEQEIAFSFDQKIDLKVISGQELLERRIKTPNPDVFAKLTATRDSTPWHVAARALKTVVDFTVNEYYQRAIVAQMKKNPYYNDYTSFMQNRGKVLTDNGAAEDRPTLVFNDQFYGFGDPQNLRFWAMTCNAEQGGFNKKLLMDFFMISSSAMNPFLQLFCSDWDAAQRNVDTTVCITSN